MYTAGYPYLMPFHQISLMHQCTLVKKLGENVFIVHENVPLSANHHMHEPITRVHVVNMEGYMWEDHERNVVPTCTCPANRNLKDCCAGIMVALKHREEFTAWYGTSFMEKRELLSRRLRADLDPVRVYLVMSFSEHLIYYPN